MIHWSLRAADCVLRRAIYTGQPWKVLPCGLFFQNERFPSHIAGRTTAATSPAVPFRRRQRRLKFKTFSEPGSRVGNCSTDFGDVSWRWQIQLGVVVQSPNCRPSISA